MIVTKRTQGRPSRDSGINGRDKLIEATRRYLQSHRRVRLTRTEIAQGCGVTPALISYYFKDKNSLVEAVTKPLIRAYSAKLLSVQRDSADLNERLQRTIHLLIDVMIDDAFLVDHLLGAFATNRLDEEDRRALDDVHRAIGGLLADLAAANVWRPSDLVLTEVALWGMCRAFGEALRVRLATPLHAGRRRELVVESVGFVCEAFAATAPVEPPDPSVADG